ncbi:type VI secretion system tip protein VgrG [Vibrio sp. S4M6]|uniref:type VI secretion system Vgr family protein n=1 Tax=Vibrio sinus TaxID=2946865 RepID=UPI00202A8E45|nr:type VI secretion system tip protein TssI/VgrG [Vibrio sinus]MCL9783479.1 type VI secretion system tip protein VgrG [Vibrio sinus]
MDNALQFKFELIGSEHQLRVERFRVTERLSAPFEVDLSLISLDSDLCYEAFIRKPALLKLFGQGVGVSRLFHGIVSEFRYTGQDRRFSCYQLKLVSNVWFLSQRQDCRIFQHKSIIDIVKDVFEDAQLTDYRLEISQTYPSKDYVVQYRESDLTFVDRLLAEHGLWYYFEHLESGHFMVIVDSNEAIQALSSTPLNATSYGPLTYHPKGGGIPDSEHIFKLEEISRVRTGCVTFTDYDYEQPNIPQEQTSSAETYQDLAHFDYPGRYSGVSSGKRRTSEKSSEYINDMSEVECHSDILRLGTGISFSMSEHPRQALNDDYLLLCVEHFGRDPQVYEEQATGEPTTYYNQFFCRPTKVEFKPQKFPAPIVDGPQTAVVVGPEGEEIYTDQLGRIKVQFHWDRYAKHNEASSCWVRVSQSMAATSWGAVYLPRIGHEVVVTFLEGDPDKPLITGVVYNGVNLPPYALPENKTRTTFRTQTHKGVGYNELSFEDEANKEEIYFHAQKDMSTKVLNCRYRDIGQDEFLVVGKNQTNEVHGDQKETVDGNKTTLVKTTFSETVEQDVNVKYQTNESHMVTSNQDISVGESRTCSITKNDTLSVGEKRQIKVGASQLIDIQSSNTMNVGGAYTLTVDENTALKTEGVTQITSGESIVLSTGSASLVMKSDGSIRLSGSSINIEGTGDIVIQGANVAVN